MAWARADAYRPFGAPEDGHHHRLELPRFGYRGELALGSLIDLRARLYDAELGRFTSRDPVSPQLAGGGSPYVYADNDPLDKMDPLGALPIPTAGGFLSSVLGAVSTATSSVAARAANIIRTNVQLAAKGPGGDRTRLHNLAVDTAENVLVNQMSRKYGISAVDAFNAFQTEVKITGAGKHGAVDGSADLVFTHAGVAYIWEAKSDTINGGPAAASALATGEAADYVTVWNGAPVTPGTTAALGDNMATRAPIPNIVVGNYQWYACSLQPNVPLVALLYGPMPLPPAPKPVPVPVPQPQPESKPWYEEPWLPWNWDVRLPTVPPVSPATETAVAGGAAAILLIGGLLILAL